jgi:hypothetical protein
MPITITIERSPRTHWNGGRTEQRVWRDGHYVRRDAEAIALRRVIFGSTETPTVNKGDALANARKLLGL